MPTTLPLPQHPGSANGTTAAALHTRSGKKAGRLLQDEVALYGNYRELAYFYSEVYIGTPPQKFTVITDTGSSLMAVPCITCADCGHHMNPPFDPSKSSSVKPLGCGAGSCHGCSSDGLCQYSQGYAEGSSISGVFYEDKVTLGDQRSDLSVHSAYTLDFQFGCQRHEGGLFVSQQADGIMGVGQHERSITKALWQQKKLNTHMFSMCLSLDGGAMTMGAIDPRLHKSEPRWAMLQATGFYNVFVEQMMSAGATIAGAEFGSNVILDTGTTFTYVPTGAFRAIETSINAYCAADTASRCKGRKVTVSQEGLCYQLASPTDIGTFPSITIRLKSTPVGNGPGADGAMVDIVVAPQHSFINMGWDRGAYCLAFYDNGSGRGSVIGANAMMNYDVIYDLRTDAEAAAAGMSAPRVGFAASDCSLGSLPPINPGGNPGTSPQPSSVPTSSPAGTAAATSSSSAAAASASRSPPAAAVPASPSAAGAAPSPASAASASPSKVPADLATSASPKAGASKAPASAGDTNVDGKGSVLPEVMGGTGGGMVDGLWLGSALVFGALLLGCCIFYQCCGGAKCKLGRMVLSVDPRGSGGAAGGADKNNARSGSVRAAAASSSNPNTLPSPGVLGETAGSDVTIHDVQPVVADVGTIGTGRVLSGARAAAAKIKKAAKGKVQFSLPQQGGAKAGGRRTYGRLADQMDSGEADEAQGYRDADEGADVTEGDVSIELGPMTVPGAASSSSITSASPSAGRAGRATAETAQSPRQRIDSFDDSD
jgi:hypothetical protein